MECLRCGTCCVAPDIAALGKPVGVRCPNLDREGNCSVYEGRPAVCRGYRPDEICLMIASPTLDQRVKRYLELFGLAENGQRGGT